MITNENIKEVLLSEPFCFVEDAGIFSRHYGPEDGGFDLAYNADFGRFEYPEEVIADRNTTQDEHQKESFVVFLCVAHGEFHATEHAVVVYPKDIVDANWLKFLLIEMNLNQYSTGRAQPGLSVQSILDIKTTIPTSKDKQEIVAKRLCGHEKEIEDARSIIESASSRKQSILDKYLK